MQKMSEIRRHIGAVAETRKITNAMHLVATARAKKIIPRMEYNEIFLRRVQMLMKNLLLSPHLADHPYLAHRPHRRHSYIVISSDKGMAGSYNTSLLHTAWEEIGGRFAQGEGLHLTSVGMMGDSFFRRHGITPDISLGGLTQDPSLHTARKIARDVTERYNSGETEQVFLIYTPFHNGAAAAPVVHRILPIRISDFSDVESQEAPHEIVYHPSEHEAFDELVPQFLVSFIFGALMHAYASEHSARMNAMRQATRNADEMLAKLRLEYNLARQAAVTQEIAEISSALFM